MKNLLVAFAGLLIFSCSSKPFEKEIVQYFEQEVKIVPIIVEIKIDSTASMISYQEFWKDKIKENRESNKEFYEKQYLLWKDRLEERKEVIKENFRKYGLTIGDTIMPYNYMMEYKGKLDSVDIESDPIFESYNELITDKSTFKYLTAKYKLSKDGATMIQNFVAEDDSIVYKTNNRLDKFIKEEVLQKKFENIK